MMKFKTLILIFLAIIFISCGGGYEKVDNKWGWVIRSEAGEHIREIEVDEATFEVLNNKKYAKDKQNVFWEGVKIEYADPKTFTVISDNGYSKDEKYVFLDNYIIIFANPQKFEIIKWPYSKDDKYIFNGNLPMTVEDVNEFEVTQVSSGQQTSTKTFFIEWNKDYNWLDTLDIKGIITGDDSAEGQTKAEKFRGFRKIE